MTAPIRASLAVAVLAAISVAGSMTAGALLTAPPPQIQVGGQPDFETIVARIEALERRLAARPDDLEGWKMLGRSFMALNRPREAVGAWSRAAQLAPSDPDVRAALAQLSELARRSGAHDEEGKRPGG